MLATSVSFPMTPSTSSLASDGNAEFTVHSTIYLISIGNFDTGGIVGIVVGVIAAVLLCVIVSTVIGAVYYCHIKVMV